jgi:hypothetical protein
MRAHLRMRLAALAALALVAVAGLPADVAAAQPDTGDESAWSTTVPVGASRAVVQSSGLGETAPAVGPESCTQPPGCCPIDPGVDRPGASRTEPQGQCSVRPIMSCQLSALDPELFVLLVIGTPVLTCNDLPDHVSMIVDLYRGFPPGTLVDRNRRQLTPPDSRSLTLPVRGTCVSGTYYLTAQATVRAPSNYLPPLTRLLSAQSNPVVINC